VFGSCDAQWGAPLQCLGWRVTPNSLPVCFSTFVFRFLSTAFSPVMWTRLEKPSHFRIPLEVCATKPGPQPL
jgi:hypothetical protein